MQLTGNAVFPMQSTQQARLRPIHLTWDRLQQLTHTCFSVRKSYLLNIAVLCCYFRLLLSPSLLGAFAKLRKATVSFVMSVRLSVLSPFVYPHGTTRLPLTDFNEIWYSIISRKYVDRIQVLLKSDKNNWYFTWVPICIYDHIIAQFFFLEWENFGQICIENQNTHFILSNFFSRKTAFFFLDNL